MGSEMKNSKPFFSLFFVWLFILTSGNGCGNRNNPNILKVGDIEIGIEIANTPQARKQGLSDRIFLEKNHGMLFVFPRPSQQSFWMYHCHFDIDLAYIDPDGVITEIIQMKKEPFNKSPQKLKTYPSKSNRVAYVLEMNGGWFKKNGIISGVKLDLERYKTVY